MDTLLTKCLPDVANKRKSLTEELNSQMNLLSNDEVNLFYTYSKICARTQCTEVYERQDVGVW